MNLFGFKKKKMENDVCSPIDGRTISLKEVGDGVFSEKVIGDGLAIISERETIYSPIDGTVTAIFPSKHAVGITGKQGLEILVHIGIDTVDLQGKYFNSYVAQGEKIKCGEKLISFDSARIQEEGYRLPILIVVLNGDRFGISKLNLGTDVQKGQSLFTYYEN